LTVRYVSADRRGKNSSDELVYNDDDRLTEQRRIVVDARQCTLPEVTQRHSYYSLVQYDGKYVQYYNQ